MVPSTLFLDGKNTRMVWTWPNVLFRRMQEENVMMQTTSPRVGACIKSF